MQAVQILQTGVDHYRAKEFEQAESVFRGLIADDPLFAEPHHLLGVLLHDQGLVDQAISSMQRAIELGLKDARCFLNLSVMLKDQAEFDRAEKMCQESIGVAPLDPAAHFHLGVIQRALNQKKSAIASFRKVLELKPDYPEAHLALGNLFYSMEDWDEAESEYLQELQAHPHNEAARINFASMEVARKRIPQARELYQAIPEDNLHFSRAQTALAELDRTDGNLDLAIEHHLRAVGCSKKVPADNISYAVTLDQLSRKQEAIDVLASVEREYSTDADALSSVCVQYFKMDHMSHAVRVLDNVVQLQPKSALVRTNAGIIFLTLGDYRRGWPLFASRIDLIDKYANFPLEKNRRWAGENLDGKVLILVEEQGLGDTIQFVRFAQAIKQRFRCQVWFSGTTKLMGFMRSVAGVDRWLAQIPKQDHYDHWCPLPDLAWLLGMYDEVDFQAPAWYMQAESERVDAWKPRLDELTANESDLRIGICWQGSRKYKGDHTRSFPLESMKSLFQVEGVRWFSLQKGDGEEQLQGMSSSRIVDLGPEIDQDGNAFVDTAAIIERLDLVISCDSSIAHLAAAHGTPVWLALGLEPDWRWGIKSDSTCWYPATRLFRRNKQESWPEFFERMAHELGELRRTGVRRIPHEKPLAEQSIEAVRAQAIKLHADGILDVAETLYRQVLCRRGRDPVASKQLSTIYAQSGRSADSEKLLRAALETNPAEGALHFYLGQILRLLQRNDEALESLSRAAELDPHLPLLWTELSKLHLQMGNSTGVIRSLEQAVVYSPEDTSLRCTLGDQYWRAGRHAEAAEQYSHASRIEPNHASHLASLAVCWMGMGRTQDAIKALRDSLALDPRCTAALANLSAILYNRKEHDEAYALAERAVEIDPKQATALSTLGLICRHQDRHDQACDYFVRAYLSDPSRSETKLMYAWTMQIKGNQVEAKKLFDEIEKNEPATPTTLNSIGNFHRQQGDYDRARACYERAINLNPASASQAREIENSLLDIAQGKPRCPVFADGTNVGQLDALLNLGLIYLGTGDFLRGWPFYCQREGILPNLKPHFPKQRWDGSSLEGKTLLIVAEQGFGDLLQFVRFVKVIKQRYRCKIVFFAPEKMIPLLRQIPEVDVWIKELPTTEPLDCWAYLMSLPYLLGLSKENDFAIDEPYIKAPVERCKLWRDRLSQLPGMKIGLAWQGSKSYVLDAHRSIPLSAFDTLANLPNVSFVSLQKGTCADQEINSRLKMLGFGEGLDAGGAFLDTAAIIDNLDLVISCDTSIGHLSAAMGKKTWIAIPRASDWRWMLDRDDSPWYPSVRLFRQQEARNWQPVVSAMRDEILAMGRVSSPNALDVEPLVTVVIPCFNGADFIRSAIKSVVDQHVPSEIIVVDDGSTDNSVSIIREVIAEDRVPIVLICQKNRGAASARNTGMRLVRTKYVTFLDAEGEHAQGFLRTGIKFLEDNTMIPAVSFDVELMVAHRPVADWHKESIGMSLPGNILMRAECVNRMGGFPEDQAFRGKSAGEDAAFRRQLRIFGPLIQIKSPLYKYRVRQGSQLDYFLDRAYLEEGKTRVRYYTVEELTGERDRAEENYRLRIADRIIKESLQSFSRTVSVMTDFAQAVQALRDLEPNSQESPDGFHNENYFLNWLACNWPMDGAIVEICESNPEAMRWLAIGNARSKRGEIFGFASDFASLKENVVDADSQRSTSAGAMQLHTGSPDLWSQRDRTAIRLLLVNSKSSIESNADRINAWLPFVGEHGVVAFYGKLPSAIQLKSLKWSVGSHLNCILETKILMLVENCKRAIG